MQHPLTNLQIWGVPDEEMPVDKKNYFDYEKEEDPSKRNSEDAGQSGEAD